MRYDDLVESGSYICHHGVKGQKWGVRRYQNKDGSLTEAGKIRYNVGKVKNIESINRSYTSYNVDQWGKTKDTNTLWVSGLSGSGKSTIASEMSKK